jgi:hypothetical protein
MSDPQASIAHDRLDVGGVDHLAEQIAQLAVGLERQRILALGPVQRDRRDRARDRISEMLGPVAGELDAFHHGSFP